jgi:predicted heme/steroid binding protein
MKRILIGMLGLLFVVGLAACAGDDESDTTPREQVDLIELTLEELARYDGQNGNPAYIAVDGKIYDVTDDPNWSGGGHNGFLAGQDLTEEIAAASPHGTSVLSGVPQVGILVESSDSEEDPVVDEEPLEEEPVEETPEAVVLTILELAQFDGSDGSPMYVAYQGEIYDVSGIAAWASGSHGGVMAGTDVTAELAASPHGASVFEGLVPIGQLVIDSSGDGPYDPYLYLTTLELAEYNGQNGNPAYIAVAGVVYDVSDSSRWSGGSHNGFTAGQDLTDEIASISPHGTSVLDHLIIVGELIE